MIPKPTRPSKQTSRATNRRAAVKQKPTNKKSLGLACLLVDIGGYKALLPKSSMNEVIKYQKPKPFETAPEWLLGSVEWKNWQVPVISYAELSGLGKSDTKTSKYIILIKSLANNQQMPFIGVVINALPVDLGLEDSDIVENFEAPPALGVFSSIKLAGKEDALIPDLDRLNQLVAHAAYGALPITQIH
ncbi:MAG: chemotaxis protein CheW [Xanthomonadales bacterium]|nr:chemotaxis protein CheW [Xanthomonadales bacterium]